MANLPKFSSASKQMKRMICQNVFHFSGNNGLEPRKIWRENMKSSIQLVCAVALIAMLLSGCRTRARNNTTTNMTTQPTTTPTTTVTTMPETQMTTQPTTNTTGNTTTPTTTAGTDNTDTNTARSNTTPNARSGMNGQTGSSVIPGGTIN